MNPLPDQFRTPATAALDYEVSRVRERGRRGTRRLAADFDGQPCEVLEVRRGSERPLRQLLEAVTCSTVAEAERLRTCLPAVLQMAETADQLQVVIDETAEGLTLPRWCAHQREEGGFPVGLEAIIGQLLEFFSALQAAGICYGVLFPERIRVLENSPGDRRIRIDWPLDPVRLGEAADVARTPLGYVVPEFGRPDAPPTPDWDLFALGIATLWSLAGGRPPSEDNPDASPFREPPAAVSEPDLPMIPPRIIVPDLPAGWGGFWMKLLARAPGERFPDAATALESWRNLTDDSIAAVDTARAAGAQHVGVAKFTRNPRNQDRFQITFPGQAVPTGPDEPTESAAGGEEPPPELQEFEGYDIAESWSAPLVEIAPLESLAFAIADGISTVNSGEFAAQVIADSVAALDFSDPALTAAEPAGLRQLLESANRELGKAIQRRAADDQTSIIFQEDLLRVDNFPSATMVAGLLNPQRVVVGGVGDSRCYLLRGGLLDQLTLDGDRLTQLLRQGEDWRTAQQAEDRRELISWLGRFSVAEDGESILPDNPLPVTTGEQYSELSFRPRNGDILCCCSDGLSDFVDQGRIPLAEILADEPPDQACRKLVDLANECGGHDNISVIIVRLETQEPEVGSEPEEDRSAETVTVEPPAETPPDEISTCAMSSDETSPEDTLPENTGPAGDSDSVSDSPEFPEQDDIVD